MSTNGDDLARQVREVLASERAQQVIGTAQRIRATTGAAVLAGYFSWILGTIALAAGEFHYSVLERSVSFTAFEFFGFSGPLQLVLLLSFGSVFLPYWWNTRTAWLGYAVPLVLLLAAPSVAGAFADALEEYLATELNPAPGFIVIEPDGFETGIGLYVAGFAALYLGYVGIRNWFKRVPVYC